MDRCVCVLGEQGASLMRNGCIFIAAETFDDLELMHCMCKMWVSKYLLFCSFLKYQCPLTVIRNTYYLFKRFFSWHAVDSWNTFNDNISLQLLWKLSVHPQCKVGSRLLYPFSPFSPAFLYVRETCLVTAHVLVDVF